MFKKSQTSLKKWNLNILETAWKKCGFRTSTNFARLDWTLLAQKCLTICLNLKLTLKLFKLFITPSENWNLNLLMRNSENKEMLYYQTSDISTNLEKKSFYVKNLKLWEINARLKTTLMFLRMFQIQLKEKTSPSSPRL